jgi:hypothetical protein
MIPASAQPGLSHSTVNARASSTNWAGYAVTSNHIGAFRSVSAGWIQPRVNCAGVVGRRMAAFWVGLDGFNSGSVEQLGADSDCSGHHPVYFAWWEMFPAASVMLRNKVGPGDHMFASVTFRGSQTYVLFIQDSSRHWSRRIIKNEAGLDRSSAEIIAEAPALSINGGPPVIQALSDFGRVRWGGSRVNGVRLRAIPRRINITMTEVNSPAARCRTSPVGAADVFTNIWVRAR